MLLAFFLLLIPDDYQRPFRNVIRATVLRPFLFAQTQIAQRRMRVSEVPALRAQRDSLAALVAAQASLNEENRQLRAALGLSARLQDSFVSANVVQAGLSSAESTFLLDVGTADGIGVGSPVITADGLLGVVWEVSEHSAQAIDWTHPDFHVSAMTDDGSVYGIVEPRPGRSREEDVLALTGALFQVDVRPGRRVVTSGRGAQYPRGILIGTVLGIEEADTGWRKSYLIRPAVRPESARHVLVGKMDGRPADIGDIWHVSAPSESLPDTATARQPGGAP